MRRTLAAYDPEAPKDRRHVRRFGEQVQRAVAGIALQVEALPLRDRVIVLNIALKQAIDDFDAKQNLDATR